MSTRHGKLLYDPEVVAGNAVSLISMRNGDAVVVNDRTEVSLQGRSNRQQRNDRRTTYEAEVNILKGDAPCITPTELASVVCQEVVWAGSHQAGVITVCLSQAKPTSTTKITVPSRSKRVYYTQSAIEPIAYRERCSGKRREWRKYRH